MTAFLIFMSRSNHVWKDAFSVLFGLTLIPGVVQLDADRCRPPNLSVLQVMVRISEWRIDFSNGSFAITIPE